MAKKKTAPKKPPNRLKDLYGALEDQVRTQLEVRRLAHKNAEARGDAAERVWLDLLASHLPSRYRVGKGIIVDSNGKESDYIDMIIYDRHFTPPVFSDLYIPAESVYAVIEAKQELSRANIIYAGKKAQSARRLHRTNGAVVHAGGTINSQGIPSVLRPGSSPTRARGNGSLSEARSKKRWLSSRKANSSTLVSPSITATLT